MANAIQRFQVSGHASEFDYFMGSHSLEVVNEEKDLGVQCALYE